MPTQAGYKMNEVFADPQVKHLGIARKVAHKVLGDVEVVGQAIELSRTPWSIRSATPEMSRHTARRMRCAAERTRLWHRRYRGVAREEGCVGGSHRSSGFRFVLELLTGRDYFAGMDDTLNSVSTLGRRSTSSTGRALRRRTRPHAEGAKDSSRAGPLRTVMSWFGCPNNWIASTGRLKPICCLSVRCYLRMMDVRRAAMQTGPTGERRSADVNSGGVMAARLFVGDNREAMKELSDRGRSRQAATKRRPKIAKKAAAAGWD